MHSRICRSKQEKNWAWPKHDSFGCAVAAVAEDTHAHPVVRWGAPETILWHHSWGQDGCSQNVHSPKPALHVVWSCLGCRHGWAQLPGSNHSCSTLEIEMRVQQFWTNVRNITRDTFWTVGTKTSLTQASSRPAGAPKVKWIAWGRPRWPTWSVKQCKRTQKLTHGYQIYIIGLGAKRRKRCAVPFTVAWAASGNWVELWLPQMVTWSFKTNGIFHINWRDPIIETLN